MRKLTEDEFTIEIAQNLSDVFEFCLDKESLDVNLGKYLTDYFESSGMPIRVACGAVNILALSISRFYDSLSEEDQGKRVTDPSILNKIKHFHKNQTLEESARLARKNNVEGAIR